MRSKLIVRGAVCLAGAIFIYGFINLGARSFWASHTESRRANIARNMLESGDFIVPRLNGEPIFTKPPLYYWTLAGSFKLSGEASEWSARAPSVVFGLGVIALVFLMGRWLGGPLAGLCSASVLSTSYLFYHYMRLAEMDMMFTFFITFSFYCLMRMRGEDGERRGLWGVLFWISMALGFMVKGPFALLYPLSAVIALAPFDGARRMELMKACFSLAGILLFVLIVAPWFAWVYMEDGAGRVFMVEAIQRISDSRGKAHSIFYYVASLVNFAPWILLLPLAVVWALWKEADKQRLALAWFFVGMVVASVLSAKTRHYILPLYPSMSLMIGLFMAQTFTNEDMDQNRRLAGWVSVAMTAMVFVAALALPFANLFTGEIPCLSFAPCAMFIIVSACSLAIVLGGARRQAPGLIWGGLMVCVVSALAFIYGYLEPELNTRNSHKSFLAQVRNKVLNKNSAVRMYKTENFQVTFYLKQNAPVLWTTNDLKNFDGKIKSENATYYIISEKRFLDEIRQFVKAERIVMDNYYVAPSASREPDRFVLLEINYKKGKLI